MKFEYGCIGERLKHSFSKEIHNALADYDYDIIEIPREKLDEFATEKQFKAINVTIPYKEMIIPYLYEIDNQAKEIGAVNTVVNRGGKLYGYNTDFYGMCSLIKKTGIELTNKKVIILGTGGTSKTSLAVARALGASKILRVSRSAREDAISYEELYEKHSDADVIINTTPSGMYPNIFDTPVDLSRFYNLSGVVDAVYNPLRTPLVLDAKRRGIAAEGGLYMLISQAVKASEIFVDTTYEKRETDRVFSKILSEKENIVLTGMPGSGKSTVGRLIAATLNRDFIDTDDIIVKDEGKSIPEIFRENGEKYFRDAETRAIKKASMLCGAVIATGGGAILREENVNALRENGKIYFIDRPLSDLIPTNDRPLSGDKEAITKRYNERYKIYNETSDVKVAVDSNADGVCARIVEDFLK